MATAAIAAEPGTPKLDKLAAMARAAKAEYQPVQKKQVRQAKAALQRAIGDLEALMAASGKQREAGWKRYLKWDEMIKQLDAGDEIDLKELETIIGLYFNAEAAGLEFPKMMAVRDALRKYSDTFYFASSEQAKQMCETQLDALAASLEAYAKEPTAQRANEIGIRLDFLQRARQAQPLVKAVRANCWKPNLFLHASEEFVTAGVGRDVDDTAPVEDYILGTTIYGTGHTVGKVSAALAPNADQAVLVVRLKGTNTSDNIGYNGPVQIYSKGYTSVDATKRLAIDATGLVAEPAVAQCETDTQIYHIAAKCKLIQKFAWRRAGKQEGEVEWIAARHAEERVAARMDDDAQELLDKANDALVEKYRNPLLRKGAFPKLMDYSTTKDALSVKLMQTGGDQLAAPTDPPALAGDPDLAVRLHETMAANLAESLIGGVTITDERLVELLEKNKVEVPEELKIGPEKDPWSITFSRRLPFTAAFDDSTVRLAIRGTRFTRGDQPALKNSIEISATYKVEKTAKGSKLTRQGDVEVVFLKSTGPLSVRQVAFKTFLRKKFDAMFKPEFVGEGLKLPGQFEKTGKLSLVQMQSDAGWLALGWKLPPAK